MASNTTAFFLDNWGEAPPALTQPGVFTSPTLNQIVDETITVSWGASSSSDEITYHLYRDDISDLGVIMVTDNGDGTWTAVPNPTDWGTIDANDQFTLVNAQVEFLDQDTYVLSSTPTAGMLLGTTTATSMVLDTSEWLADSTVRLRVGAVTINHTAPPRYSEYFKIQHKESLYVGAGTAASIFVGVGSISEKYFGSVRVL